MEIKVLGPGCPRCEQTAEILKTCVSEAGIEASIHKVTKTMDIASHGVLGTPAVVIDNEVKCVGKIPSKAEVQSWLQGK